MILYFPLTYLVLYSKDSFNKLNLKSSPKKTISMGVIKGWKVENKQININILPKVIILLSEVLLTLITVFRGRT